MRGRDKLKKYSFIVNSMIVLWKIFPKRMRIYFYNKNIYRTGNIGILIRYTLIKCLAKKCGDNVSIFQGVYILHPENISIGSNVSIHEMSYIDALNSSIIIGDDVSIAHGVTILSSTHNYSSPTINIKDQGMEYKTTIIENNVWLGAKSTILAGIRISSGSIVGAGAVVTKNVAKDRIVCGVPAREIKKRV